MCTLALKANLRKVNYGLLARDWTTHPMFVYIRSIRLETGSRFRYVGNPCLGDHSERPRRKNGLCVCPPCELLINPLRRSFVCFISYIETTSIKGMLQYR
jgi:hypothetical protein